MTPDQLREYVTAMRELGVRAFKSADIEIALGPEPARSVTKSDYEPPRKGEYEKLLFAATEGLPEEDA